MKTIFIPVKSKSSLNYDLPKNLPKNIAIAYSIQYENQARDIKQKLSKSHNITNFIQVLGCSRPLGDSYSLGHLRPLGCLHPSGCSNPLFSKSTQAVLLIGSGRFHAINLALQTNLPIYILEENQITQISEKEIIQLKQKKKSSYVNFLNSNKIGILISIKPGQQNLEKAISIKKSIKNKKSYLFISNNINISEFENFPDIQSWVNTACPRIDMNSNKIVNVEEINLNT